VTVLQVTDKSVELGRAERRPVVFTFGSLFGVQADLKVRLYDPVRLPVRRS